MLIKEVKLPSRRCLALVTRAWICGISADGSLELQSFSHSVKAVLVVNIFGLNTQSEIGLHLNERRTELRVVVACGAPPSTLPS